MINLFVFFNSVASCYIAHAGRLEKNSKYTKAWNRDIRNFKKDNNLYVNVVYLSSNVGSYA